MALNEQELRERLATLQRAEEVTLDKVTIFKDRADRIASKIRIAVNSLNKINPKWRDV